MKKVTLAEAKAFWETVKDGKPYCTKLETYGTGGGILATEMPIEYEGMECLLTLFDDDNLAMCINRRNGFWEDGEETENVIIFDIGWNERVPEFLIESARILMKNKCEYYDEFNHGFDYKRHCKENCSQDAIYEGLFEKWEKEYL